MQQQQRNWEKMASVEWLKGKKNTVDQKKHRDLRLPTPPHKKHLGDFQDFWKIICRLAKKKKWNFLEGVRIVKCD